MSKNYNFHVTDFEYLENYIDNRPELDLDFKVQKYSQDDIIKKLEVLFASNALKKGVGIEHGDHITYTFQKLYNIDGKEEKQIIRIFIDNEMLAYEKVKDFANRLNEITEKIRLLTIEEEQIKKLEKIKLVKSFVKKGAIVAAIIGGIAAGVAGLSYALDGEAEYENKLDAERKAERDAAEDEYRRNNNMPPLRYKDKNGNPYDTWEEFNADYYGNKEGNYQNEILAEAQAEKERMELYNSVSEQYEAYQTENQAKQR